VGAEVDSMIAECATKTQNVKLLDQKPQLGDCCDELVGCGSRVEIVDQGVHESNAEYAERNTTSGTR
jgi:hypothetical protein